MSACLVSTIDRLVHAEFTKDQVRKQAISYTKARGQVLEQQNNFKLQITNNSNFEGIFRPLWNKTLFIQLQSYRIYRLGAHRLSLIPPSCSQSLTLWLNKYSCRF